MSRQHHQANGILATTSRAPLSGRTSCCSRSLCVRGYLQHTPTPALSDASLYLIVYCTVYLFIFLEVTQHLCLIETSEGPAAVVPDEGKSQAAQRLRPRGPPCCSHSYRGPPTSLSFVLSRARRRAVRMLRVSPVLVFGDKLKAPQLCADIAPHDDSRGDASATQALLASKKEAILAEEGTAGSQWLLLHSYVSAHLLVGTLKGQFRSCEVGFS